MIRQSVIAFAAAAALATGAMAQDMQRSQQGYGQQQSQQDSSQQQAQQAGGQMGGETEAMSTNPDRAFAATMISHARLNRQVAELVSQKATDPQVKQLAQDIANDYQQISQRIQQAAQQANITVHPDRLLPRDQAVLNHMQQLPVNVLERDFVFMGAGANQTHMLFSQWAAQNAQNPQIKQVAQDVANKLQQRNQRFQQLAQAEISGGARPAGGGMGPGGDQ